MALIRFALERDAAQIQAIYSPIVSQTATSFEMEPPSIDEIRRRITDTLLHLPWLVCEHQGQVLGYAYASRHRVRAAYQWSVDVSVYVHAEARRMGIGRAAYHSLFQILRRQGFYNAYAGIALPNPASVGLHESVGFKPLGVYKEVGFKFGAWHDVGWWWLLLQPKAIPPQPPVDLPLVQGVQAWEKTLADGAALLRV